MISKFSLPKDLLQYDVVIQTFDSKSGTPQNQYSYKIELWTEHKNLHVKRYEPVLMDMGEEETVLNEMLLIASGCVEDLVVEVNQKGEIEDILNFTDIQDKWEEIRFKIENTYVGSIVPEIIAQHQEIIEDKQKFIQSLYKDIFWESYFGLLWNDSFPFVKKVFCLGYSEPLEIRISRQSINLENGKKQVQITLYPTDSSLEILRKKWDENYENTKISVNFAGNYLLSKTDEIETINLSFLGEVNENTAKEVKLKISINNVHRNR